MKATQGTSHIHQLARPLDLDCGTKIDDVCVSYQTYGKRNADSSNVFLICHALTGDQYVAGKNPQTGKRGWWHRVVGPNKPIDTNRFFVICQNVLGGCSGTTGPSSLDAKTNKPYGLSFPVITIADMVRAQKHLLDELGIDDLFCVIGGSMGGMQVLQWSASYGEKVFSAIPIATAAHHSAQNIAFHEVGRQAIMADTSWHGGSYVDKKTRPHKGLAVARMAAHVTYLSESSLHRKFGRALQDRKRLSYGFDAEFQIESYLRHQGSTFVERFDANSYLFITKAMDYFDLGADYDGILANAFSRTRARFCVVSFTSDWLFPTSQSLDLVRAINAAGGHVSFVEIDSDNGHDAFLLDEPEMNAMLRGFIASAAKARGI